MQARSINLTILPIASLLVLAWATAFAPSAQAADTGPIEQCWTPVALAGTDAERNEIRNGKRLDITPLKKVVTPQVTPIPPELRGSIRGVELPPGEKLIALSFDLCEENGYVSGYDGRIVDLLRKENVKATFMAGGKWMETHPDRAEQLIADPLFEVGSHGLRHYDLSRTPEPTLSDEITLVEAAYEDRRQHLLAKQCLAADSAASLQDRIHLIRFPFGTCDPKSLEAAGNAGMLTVQWTVVTGDPDPHQSAEQIERTILTKVHPGAIIIGHANGRGWHTAEALAVVIPKLKAEGYQFVTVSELIKAGKPILAQSCYMNRPGDMTKIAHSTAPKQGHAPPSIFDGIY